MKKINRLLENLDKFMNETYINDSFPATAFNQLSIYKRAEELPENAKYVALDLYEIGDGKVNKAQKTFESKQEAVDYAVNIVETHPVKPTDMESVVHLLFTVFSNKLHLESANGQQVAQEINTLAFRKLYSTEPLYIWPHEL